MLELMSFQLRTRLRSTLVWAAAIGLTSALILASYTAFNPADLKQMTQALSSDMLAAFGMTPDSLASPEGYLASQFLLLVPIALAFYPTNAAAKAIAGAEASGSLDVLLGTPVSRSVFPLATFGASTIGLALIACVYAVLTYLTALLFGIDLSAGDIAVSALGMLPISMLFGAIAVLVSTLVRTPGLVTGVAGGLAILTYVLNALVMVQPSLDWAKWLTPYHYYGSPIERGLDAGDQAILLAAAAVLLAASLPVFRRRDIRA